MAGCEAGATNWGEVPGTITEGDEAKIVVAVSVDTKPAVAAVSKLCHTTYVGSRKCDSPFGAASPPVVRHGSALPSARLPRLGCARGCAQMNRASKLPRFVCLVIAFAAVVCFLASVKCLRTAAQAANGGSPSLATTLSTRSTPTVPALAD